MLECVSVENMRLSDCNTIEKYVSGIELISRAAYAVFNSVEWRGKIAVLTGGGNNGADGYALAKILYERDFDVRVYAVSQNLHSDCLEYANWAKSVGVPVIDYSNDMIQQGDFDIVVDCMLGTGFKGEVRERYKQAIEDVNQSDAYIISVDINSGMDGDSGEGVCVVSSDLTISIEFIKNGQVSESAGKYIKQLISVPIGIRLAYEENKICNESEWDLIFNDTVSPIYKDGTYYYKRPPWLRIK